MSLLCRFTKIRIQHGHVSGIRQMLVPSAICSIDLYMVAWTFRTCGICDIYQMPLMKGLGKAERILYSAPVIRVHTVLPSYVFTRVYTYGDAYVCKNVIEGWYMRNSFAYSPG